MDACTHANGRADDGRTDARTHAHTHACMHTRMHLRTHGRTRRQTDGRKVRAYACKSPRFYLCKLCENQSGLLVTLYDILNHKNTLRRSRGVNFVTPLFRADILILNPFLSSPMAQFGGTIILPPKLRPTCDAPFLKPLKSATAVKS